MTAGREGHAPVARVTAARMRIRAATVIFLLPADAGDVAGQNLDMGSDITGST